jgi:hypothetical protein
MKKSDLGKSLDPTAGPAASVRAGDRAAIGVAALRGNVSRRRPAHPGVHAEPPVSRHALVPGTVCTTGGSQPAPRPGALGERPGQKINNMI